MHESTRINTNPSEQGQVVISPGDDDAGLLYEPFVSIREIRAEVQVDAPSDAFSAGADGESTRLGEGAVRELNPPAEWRGTPPDWQGPVLRRGLTAHHL